MKSNATEYKHDHQDLTGNAKAGSKEKIFVVESIIKPDHTIQ